MSEREEFVLLSMEKGADFSALCERFGISRKTGYKWRLRFHAGGLGALHDQSTKPRTSPGGLCEDVVCRIVDLKTAHRHWGPRKIQALYGKSHPLLDLPSESSFKRVLEKAGLVEKRINRRPASQAGRIQLRRQAEKPNDVWTVDFKGWWLTAERLRFEPLTIRDAKSRFIICADPLDDAKTQTVKLRFEKAFETYGLPETIRSDNGPPFASPNGLLGLSALSAWWMALGISLDRIDPGRPDQNGAHERMHRDMSLEVEGAMRGRSLCDQRAALALWRETYNTQRPHEALGYQTPCEHYRPSERSYEGAPSQLAYPDCQSERKVAVGGTIHFKNASIFLSTALRGWNVGLKSEENNLVGVWFAALRIGAIDPGREAFLPAQTAVEMPP